MQILRLKDVTNTDIDVNRIVCTNQHWSGKQHNWSYLNSPRPCDGLIYISHGGAIYTNENGQSIAAKCGDILYLPNKSRYFVEFEPSASRSMLLNFMLYHKNDEAVFSDKIFVAAHDEDSTLRDMFDAMCDIYSRSTGILTLKSELFSLLRALSQSSPHDETVLPIHTAITYINNHLNEIPSVAELAKMCAMSESTFRRSFRRALGISPKKYINGLKIEKSKQLLRGSKLAVGEICDLLGFYDCAYFVKLFKEVVGVNPSAYRNRR